MYVGVKNSTAKPKVHTFEHKKNTTAKTGNKHNNNTDDADNASTESHISDKLEISSNAKTAQSYSPNNTQAGTQPQASSHLPAQAAQNAQNEALTNEQWLVEQAAAYGYNDIQAFIEDLLAANENAFQAFIDNLLATNQNALQTLLEQMLGTSESTHILDFLTTIKAPDRNDNDDNSGSNIDDPTRRLTRRLVSARTTHEIHSILSEATKSLGDAILAAANGDEEAQQVVRRLTRLIRRAQRKIGDLNSEEQTRQKEVRARERELEELARQLELELRRKIAERERRERGYLRNLDDEENNVLPLPGTLSSGSFTAAQIKAMAWQAAKAAIASQAAAPAMPVGSIAGGSIGGISSEASLSGGAAASGESAPSGDAA